MVPNKPLIYGCSSIHQRNSWKPLSITVPMLRTIMELNDVTPEFLEIILSFYERKVALEEAFNSSVLRRQKGDILGISRSFPGHASLEGN
jgi:hypothetical protein